MKGIRKQDFLILICLPVIKNIKETYKNFSLLSDENKLIWLLSSEDKQIIIHVHLFGLLFTLFLERDKIIMNG